MLGSGRSFLMAACLLACPGCARHVRLNESRCPFCRVALPDDFGGGQVPVPPPAGLSRAGLLSYGALRIVVGTGVLVSAAMMSAGCDAGNSSDYGGPPPEVPIAGTPDSCSGHVYFEVPPSTDGCLFGPCPGPVAYAVCEPYSHLYLTCSCNNPVCDGDEGYTLAPGSPDAAGPPGCDAGSGPSDAGRRSDAHDAAFDAPPPRDALEGGRE
jgi:hypothetical protein